MKNEIRINVPEGMEIDRENSTFECIRLKPKKRVLPKTWREFCDMTPIKDEEEAYISAASTIVSAKGNCRGNFVDANVLPSRKYAEAMLALCKLIQLRECYNDGWQADWSDTTVKYVIVYNDNSILYTIRTGLSAILNFKTEFLREEFCVNFRDLIEKAKPLL